MRVSPRLEGALPPEFSTPVIDRSVPVRFTLDDIEIAGFAGDTVLTALLASGIDTAGRHRGHPLALEAATAPPVALAGAGGAPMPMALCPALSGLRLTTLGPRRALSPLGRLRKLMAGAPGALEGDFDAAPPAFPWRALPPDLEIDCDIAIVGGGIAGLSALAAARRRGVRAVLLERGVRLGGLSAYFGRAENEPSPDALLDTLLAETDAAQNPDIFLTTHAFSCRDGVVEAIRVVAEGGTPAPQRLSIRARHIVLATGISENLPVFAGNRLPGVVRSGAAWRLMAEHNLWPGATALLQTGVNAAYRLAPLAAECGRTVLKLGDPRLDPQSRFIAFAKAHGFRLGWATAPSLVSPAADGKGLRIRLSEGAAGILRQEIWEADRLIVAGGWQPALGLWLAAGGDLAWNGKDGQLRARGALPGVVLAGAAAGLHSPSACGASGEAAIARLLGGRVPATSDPRVDAAFETPDALPLAASVPAESAAPAYTGATPCLNILSDPRSPLLPLGLTDIGGLVASGRAAPSEAPALAAERGRALPPFAEPGPFRADAAAPETVPPWLAGRFGPGQAVAALSTGAGRALTPGCPIFSRAGDRAPLEAVGVVLGGHGRHGQRALMAQDALVPGATVFARDGTLVVPATVERRLGAFPE